MDEVDVSINKSRDSFITDVETNRCNDLKTNSREEIAASTLSSADENVLSSNGLHESISCEEEGGRPYEGDESNSDAAVCSSDVHVTSGCKATLQTKLRSKTNGELRTAPCCIDVGVDDDHEAVVAHESMSNETADESCKTIPEDSKIIESNNHLLELMEFLQAPTDCSRNVKIDDHTITIDSSDNNVKIDKTPKLPSQCAILTRLLASGHSSPKSEIHNDEVDISEDHDLISERDHLENTPVTDSNSNGSDQALSFENRISRDLSATRETSFDGCNINSSSPVISITNQDDSNIVKDQSHLSEVPLTSPSQPPECDDDDMTDSSESTNKSIGHVNVPQGSPIDCSLATITTCPTSTISLPTSHRPLKKRIGLENILLRRLLLAAKPVNHHSADVLSEEQISNLSEDMDIGEGLTSLKSVQVLTNHPQSITVLQNESDTNKTVKEILEHNSIMGDDQMSCDDSENSSKRLHKRKCSSPHRIVKKSLIKTEEDGDIDKLVYVSSPQMSPTSLISKEIPCIPSLSTMTSVPDMTSNIQIPHTKISPLPNAVPFLPGLSMNVITIAPDENYVEPTSFLKQKPPPAIKPLRQLAPKSSCNPAPSQKNISNNILTSKHITAPTNVIPISLVQNTTNPPLVILVNKADTKCAQFISAQPFQLQAHLPQQRQQLRQQVSIAEQIKPPNVSISNIVPGLLTMRSPQAQHLLKSQPVLSQQQQISFPQAVLSGRSRFNSMPKLKLISDKTSSKTALLSSSPNAETSPDSNLENFFEPFRNNCIVGKFVAPVVDSSKLTSGEGCSSSEKFVCGSCGCTYSSETALKEHYQRKSFLVTFQCSCQSGEAARSSTFYNLCSFSTHYRHHVLQHPYVPHSPANSYKVTSLPDDQLSDKCLKLMKEKSLVLSQEQRTMSEEPAKTTPSLHFSEPLNPKKEEVRQTLQCKECCKEFRLPLRIKQHFQNKVAMKSNILEKGDATSNSFHKCPKCDIFLPSSCSFRAHSRLHDSSEPYVCPECGLTFSTFEVMKEHAYKICHHGCRRTGIKGCQFCNFIPQDSASFPESLDLHILKVHKSSSFKCKFCPELFKDIVSAHKHSQLKHGVIIKDSDLQIINKCPVCELQLNCPIEMHVLTHDVESKSKIFYFSCTECSRNFGHRADLEKHLRSTGHLGMKVNGFVCKLCALTFPSREDRCNHITTEHPNLKDMFFSEINNYDLPSLPLIGRREVVSPSNLFAVKSMPNLRLIDPNTTHGVSSNENIQELEGISSVLLCNADMRLSCSDTNKNDDRTPVANSDGTSEVPPERWECSRCNEIFVNKATFHRHQQKHRFLETSKTKKRKLNADSEMPSDKAACLVAPSMSNTAENNDAAPTTMVKPDLVCNASGDAVNNIGVSRQSSLVSANQELEEDAAVNDHGSANASSIDLTEHRASLKGATETNCKILPHRLQRQQLQQLPELLEHLPPYLKSDDGPAKDGLSNTWNSCQLCCMSFKSSQKLEHHVAVRHEGLNLVKPETFTCAYCPDSNKRVFISTRHLHRHLKVRHKIIRSKTGQYMSLDASKTDTNQQKGFTSPDTRDGEESSAEGKCSSEPFPTSPFSEDHGNACLDDSSAAIEDVDDDKTKDPENIKSRKIFGNSEDVYTCSYCDRACSDRSTFWDHIISHEDLFGSAVIKNNKTFQCPECGSMFVVRTALFRHLKLVHRIFSEQEYESELDQFKSFRANFCKSVESSKLHNQEESITPKACQGDLPADKLAKLAAIRPEDIHNGVTNAPQTPFFPVETSSDCMSQRRKGLRSQIKSESMECSSNPDQGSNSSGEFHDHLSQNECQVCYRSFDSQVELKQHMRVHGMAFIQGTRRNLTNANQSQAGETSPTQTPTNLKAIVA